MNVDSSPLYTHPLVASAAYEHIAHFPPHGPFAHLSALSLIDVLDTHFGVRVSVEEVLGFFKAHYRVDHLRGWASLYVAADLRQGDVEALPES